MQIVRYNTALAQEWDAFVKVSRNGTFLFLRAYMDYHAYRFADHSLMYYGDKGRLLAVMPANEAANVLYSHQGLTYGGLVMAKEARAEHVCEMVSMTKEYLRSNGFSEWYYKQIPTPYQTYPSQEDEYALWLNGAEVQNCKLGSAVVMTDDDAEYASMTSSRKRTYCNKLLRTGYTIDMNASLEDFWPVLTDNLRRSFGALPVHTLQEMQMLQQRFPDNIACCTIRNADGEIEAGTVLYLTGSVVHTQYISATAVGKQTNAMDCLMLSLIKHYREEGKCDFFELGTSMDDDNIHLKPGLIAQKEGFGGRGVAYKLWRIAIC